MESAFTASPSNAGSADNSLRGAADAAENSVSSQSEEKDSGIITGAVPGSERRQQHL